MNFDDLDIINYSGKIAALPKRRNYSVLPPRHKETFITFHYSAVNYADRSEAAELRRILDEAKYQMHHDYGGGAYPDGLLYDYVVLSNGLVVKTRNSRQQLWHAGNSTANSTSWAVHVMLGGKQDVTPAQRQSLFNLFDVLRSESNIPRQNLIAHCEWPRRTGLPVRASSYRLLPQQSQCPGVVLFNSVVLAYRAIVDAPQPPTVTQYKVRPGGGTLRNAPKRDMAHVVRNVPIGTPLNIIGETTGDVVQGNATWMVIKGTPVMYIHSSAVERA